MKLKSLVLIFFALSLVAAAVRADEPPYSQASNNPSAESPSFEKITDAQEPSVVGTSSGAIPNKPGRVGIENGQADQVERNFYETVASRTHDDQLRLIAEHEFNRERRPDRTRDDPSRPVPVPEPGALILVVIGLVMLGLSAIARILFGSDPAPRIRSF